MLDPFLLLDEFGTDKPEDYLAGFPDHPHRGFETVTYMLDGRMRHKDNHGNEGLLVPGSVQWMTAGRGLVHSEMPEQQEGRMRGFQLWVNLPAQRQDDRAAVPGIRAGAHSRRAARRRRQRQGDRRHASAMCAVRSCSRRPIRCTSTSRSPRARMGVRIARRPQRVRLCVRRRRRRSATARMRARSTRRSSAVLGGGDVLQAPRRRAGRARDPGRGPAAARAGGALRSVRDEHARRK